MWTARRATPARNDVMSTLSRASVDAIVSRLDDAHRIGRRVAVDELAACAGVSTRAFRVRFVATFGVSPRNFVTSDRWRRFRECLRTSDDVTTAVYEAGFGSTSRAYDAVRHRLGMTPDAYRRGGDAVAIGWTTVPCALGTALVAATADGICAVYLGEDEARLADELRREFPRATLTPIGPPQDAWVDAVVRAAAGEIPPTVPLDLRGTAFQQKVWAALRTIPRGSTWTYGDLAARIGQPAAVRAAARACATNKVALLVPCHRVVGRDGALTGYRWGTGRKRRILDAEGGDAS
jgi:AraC family transcriptional regulator, regulatory protein of adaptative response / methylated-DNA-[protein]-cysteine methyltransferase